MTLSPTVYIVDKPGCGLSLHLLNPGAYALEMFGSGRQFLETAHVARPACLILDLQLPDMGGDELLRQLRAASDMPVIMTCENWDMQAALRTMRLGILDFCPKPVDPQKLRELVGQALTLDAEITQVRARIENARRKLAQLTARQRELFTLFAGGLSHKEIASVLDISPRTVEHHRAHLNAQLGTDRLADLVHLNLLAGGTQALYGVCPDSVAAAHIKWSQGCRQIADAARGETPTRANEKGQFVHATNLSAIGDRYG